MAKKKNTNSKCAPGEILRKGYKRKGFTRKDGVRVNAAYVPPTCIVDRGKPGRGKKNLPMPGDDLHLSTYGYTTHRTDKERRAALRAASEDNSILEVYRRLNLIRNLQPTGEVAKDIMSKDVEYMKNLYKRYREKNKRSSNQKGGADEMENVVEISDSTDDVVDNIELPEKIVINAIVDTEKICDADGNCGVRNKVYEEHVVNGKQIIYYTLEEKDADDILSLDRLYLDSEQTRDQVLEKIRDNSGLLIGLKVDGVLQAYAHYDPEENLETKPSINRIPVDVRIVWFCANNGYGTTLYQFLERYFKASSYNKIKVVVNLEGPYRNSRLNFWFDKGFRAAGSIDDKKQIEMEKKI